MLTVDEAGLEPVFSDDPTALWRTLRAGIYLLQRAQPAVFTFLQAMVGAAGNLNAALAAVLFFHLFRHEENPLVYRHMLEEALSRNPSICRWAIRDLRAFSERDPASLGVLPIFFFNKGFVALQAHRVAHEFWHAPDGRLSAQLLQFRTSIVCAVDIHPAARMGSAIFLDHATGLVIGETAVVEDDVSILHEVTLGGTGKHRGDRHPKIRRGVFLAAGAKILGNIEVGEGATVGAGSVVLQNVPPGVTVAGVPAKVVSDLSCRHGFRVREEHGNVHCLSGFTADSSLPP